MTATDWTALRTDLWMRAGGRCEACRKPLGQQGVVHHRRLRSQGGSDDPANLILIHDDCHRRIHGNVLWARQHGLIVPSYADPADRPVQTCDDPTCANGDYDREGA